jgi:DNA repair exonuclease SbcCD ATPase subunit
VKEALELEELTKKYSSPERTDNRTNDREFLSKKLEKIKSQLPLLEKKRREYVRYKDLLDMNLENIAKVEKKITLKESEPTLHLEKEIANLKKRVKRYEERVQKALELKGKSLEYSSYLKEYNSYTRNVEKVNEITSSLVKKKKEHSDLTAISSCITQAELISTEEITSFINERALQWLERFFGDQCPIVRFVLGKEIGKGRNKRVKHVLNVEIMLKGALYDNIKFLSKGERKRVKLALLLAFSDVLDSPHLAKSKLPRMYLLDECLSNLDCEIQTEILAALKEKSDSLFLVVSHDAIKGIFTDVVTW